MLFYEGKEYSKQDLLRCVGNIEQIAYVKKLIIDTGKAESVKIFDINNGGGLEFSVMESKCLDIMDMKYKGINLRFLSKPGLVSVQHADLRGVNYTRSIAGGFMYTCGLSNVGAGYTDETAEHYTHGRLRFLPADQVCAEAKWKDDDYSITIKGHIRDAGLFRDNIVIRREIKTAFGGKTILLNDEIENEGFEKQPYMIMYHVNLGFPLLDEGLEFLVPQYEIYPIHENSKIELENWNRIPGPIDHYNETAYIHKILMDKQGFVYSGVYNHKLNLGLYIKNNAKELPHLLEWKSMMSGDYAFGIMPTNNFIMGRKREMELDNLKYIEPFEIKKNTIEFGIIEGEESLREFRDKLNQCVIKP